MVVTASFDSILSYIGFTLWLFTGLTVLGLFVLRWRERRADRPYRTWGYPITPALFLLLSLWMVAHAVWQRTMAAAAGRGTTVSGLVLCEIVERIQRRANRASA